METVKLNLGLRLLSMLIDHIIMCLIIVVILAPVMMLDVKLPLSLYFFIIAFSLYFCKDSINGQSIGKRLFGFQLVNIKNNKPATAFQCVIRNLFCVLWPIEVVVTLFSRNRRIGDFVAFTMLIKKDNNLTKNNNNVRSILLAYVFAIALMFSFYFLFLDSYISK